LVAIDHAVAASFASPIVVDAIAAPALLKLLLLLLLLLLLPSPPLLLQSPMENATALEAMIILAANFQEGPFRLLADAIVPFL